MKIYRTIGELILGTRLKRLSDRFLLDVAKIYKSLDIPFEPSWFPIFYLLDQNKKMTVGEIAQQLDITQSSVSQMSNLLTKKKLIKYGSNKNDKRIRIIYFTPVGEQLLEQVKPVWESLKYSMRGMLNEHENSAFLLPALDEFEDAVSEKSIYQRVIDDVKMRRLSELTLLPYDPIYESRYKALMFSWFSENENIEITDPDLINVPQKIVDQQKGLIMLAKVGEEIIGAVVIQFIKKEVGHISIFSLENQWRHRQIGKKIISETLNGLKKRGIRSVQIAVDRKHSWLIKCFKETGFQLDLLQSEPNRYKTIQLILVRSVD